MTDSPESTASDGPVTDTAAADADAADSSTEGDPKPEIDADALRKELSGAGAQAALAADLASLKRTMGHMPGVQSKLDSLERTMSTEIGSLKQGAARFDAFLDALPEGFISDRAMASLRTAVDSNGDLRAEIAELKALVSGTPDTDKPEDPRAAAARGQWDAATASVERYATGKGYDATQIPDAVWQRALEANPSDPTAATLEVAAYVDKEVGAAARRAEKKDAASGGADGERLPRTSGATKMSDFKSMSVEQIREFMRTDPDGYKAALTNG
ncbi:MAG: hypothetical protein NUW01_03615 [Gemmatimonadaceae bacterium]|nr:hypothetical protein [Gemmatimonadaceae bacterium]